jgi:membrane associated rhomboid family serine protease
LIPLRDINPTRVFPVVTLALIIANVVVFFFVQPGEEPDSERFFYEYAAISCELTTGDPLDVAEITDEVCRDQAGSDAPFPDKNVYLAALISLFLHGGIGHLLFNMWSLWIFGNNVEGFLSSAPRVRSPESWEAIWCCSRRIAS